MIRQVSCYHLNYRATEPRLKAFPPYGCWTPSHALALQALRLGDWLSPGISTYLKQGISGMSFTFLLSSPTPWRALRRPILHWLATGLAYQQSIDLAFPVQGCLAASHLQGYIDWSTSVQNRNTLECITNSTLLSGFRLPNTATPAFAIGDSTIS